MKKEIFAILISLLLFFVNISGCTEKTSDTDEPKKNEEPKIIELQKIVYIDDDYNKTISGWGIDHFNTVQNGINNVTEGGTVYIYNGVYFENLVVNKSITMIGEDKETTIIKSGEKNVVVTLYADNCTIQNLNISSGFLTGVKIFSNRNNLTNNTIYDNYDGVRIDSLSDNIISNNVILKNKNGIRLKNSFNNTIIANKFLSDNLVGIILESSYNISIINNVFQNNGIKISGLKSDWNTHVIENNTGNNKNIYYYKNMNGITVPNDAAQIILANCTNFKISNIIFENISDSIQIGYCSNIKLENNYFSSSIQNAIQLSYSNYNNITTNVFDSLNGIDLSKSDDNVIWHNTIGSTEIGISMTLSNYNNISENNIFSNNEYGIYIHSNSNYNRIFLNKIHDNQVGVRLKSSKYNDFFNNELNNNYDKGLYICCGSENNLIYNNSFIKNLEHIDYAISEINYFYKDEIGNYWDDYLERYPNATQLNGFWDTPYEIPFSSFEDKYPLVKSNDI